MNSSDAKPDTDGLYQSAQNMTMARLRPALERLDLAANCETCRTGVYEFAESKGVLMALAQPIAPDNERALWFFIAVCSNCSHTKFFLAPSLTERVMQYEMELLNERH